MEDFRFWDFCVSGAGRYIEELLSELVIADGFAFEKATLAEYGERGVCGAL